MQQVSTTKGKRAKSAAVPCCTSMLPVEISAAKENKGKNTHKLLSTTFGKKEGPSGRKKGKILCDVLPVPVPVPSKRPKVAKKLMSTGGGGNPGDIGIDSEAVGKKLHDTLQVEIAAGIQIGDVSVATIDTAAGSYFNGPNTSTDIEPCCSSSLCAQVGGVASAGSFSAVKAKKLMSGALAAAAVASNSLSGTTGVVTTKKLKIRSKFGSGSSLIVGGSSSSDLACGSGSSSGLLLKPMKRSNTSKDSLRLKKKKTLKADANLKRKKSRVF